MIKGYKIFGILEREFFITQHLACLNFTVRLFINKQTNSKTYIG